MIIMADTGTTTTITMATTITGPFIIPIIITTIILLKGMHLQIIHPEPRRITIPELQQVILPDGEPQQENQTAVFSEVKPEQIPILLQKEELTTIAGITETMEIVLVQQDGQQKKESIIKGIMGITATEARTTVPTVVI